MPDADAKKKALIVDDHILVLETIDQMLATVEGFQTLLARGIVGATRRLLGASSMDVIVTKLVLAGPLTGIDLCERAIELFPKIAAVMITSETDLYARDVPERCVIVVKPFGRIQLQDAIAEAMCRVSTL
jgi:two-component SAPR family response regulator